MRCAALGGCPPSSPVRVRPALIYAALPNGMKCRTLPNILISAWRSETASERIS